MTPRRNWFKSYGLQCRNSGNGQVVYAAGVGTVEFTPVKDGQKLRSVFSNVLHVPSLNQNLLSVLTLTCKHNFDVLIKSNTMEFILEGLPALFRFALLAWMGSRLKTHSL